LPLAGSGGSDAVGGDELVRSLVRGLESAVVAFSGGVDSSVVLALAVEELGADRVLAVTSAGETYLPEETAEARALAEHLGARHLVIETAELEIPGFVENPPDRCYYCKTELFGSLRAIADREGLATVVDGANSDDSRDFRPGHRAADEAGVRHPLMEAGLGKESVRSLALRLGLDNWAKPSSPCLSSRFPYGERITLEKLEAVRAAEAYLRQAGFVTFRVRHHGPVARIEVPVGELPDLLDPVVRGGLVARFKELGFAYVTVDLEGFRSGSMNEVLSVERGSV
jgi:pyridinium-3,5-biscarboxylic acid mononucleotide sulfurtransferase